MFCAFCKWFIGDFVIFVCDSFVISRKVYEKRSVICPSHVVSNFNDIALTIT